ncbi:hypothetical protein L2E82_14776 [Cichorium intybus]|uniref:Uncharacterized protein n=1 Tax=Cichorium intybus TaxID=13427 RepID=A0ACB9F102_CICIN|nr:hypothetical protein L2E82_14776 [Cichorium intybus]
MSKSPLSKERKSFGYGGYGVVCEEVVDGGGESDPGSETVESSVGDKRFVIRVSEVEGNLFKPVRLVKVGNSNHRHESNVVGDSEEEKRVESDELSSDEDQIISSDDGTQLDFSDEEEDKFDLDDDEYSFVPDTVFEEGIKDSSACDEDEREQNDKGDDLVDANDSPITPKKSEGNDTDPQFRSYACDSNTVPDTVVEERITYSVARDEEEREQNVKGDEVGLTDENDEELQIGADENTKIQYKIFEETIKPLSACEGEIMLNLGPVYEIKEASVKGGPHKPKTGLGEARDLDLLEKLFSIFSASGLEDCSLKYLGGLNVLIDFEKKNVAEAFLADHVEEVRWKEKSCWVRVQEDGVEWCPPCIVDSSVSVSKDSFDGDEGEGDEVFDTGIDIGRDLFEKDVYGNKSADVFLPVENFEISKDMHAFNNNTFDTHAKNNQVGDASVNDTHAINNNTFEIDKVVDSVNKNGDNLDYCFIGPEIDRDGDMGFCSAGPDFNLHDDMGGNSHNVLVGSEESSSNHVLPDLNHVVESSTLDSSDLVAVNNLNSQGHKRNKKSSKQGVYSMKLKDIIRSSSRGRIRIARRVENDSANSIDMGQNSPDVSLNSTSVEIEKTINLGLDVGFQMANFKEDLRTIIEGEGAAT